jgi:fibronectin-binding autotransporter adhesin
MALAVVLALGLSACGGGGGANVRPTPPPPPPPPAGGTSFTGGEIDVDANSVTVLPDNLSGSINLIKGGAGTLALTGTDTYTGGTTINLGTLQIGNGGTTGSISGNVLDNALLVFDRSDNVTFDGIVSGSGALTQAGTGGLILTGASTYTGGTTISSGYLQIGTGDTTGSIVGNVADNGSLIFDRSDNVTFDGIVSGSGALTQAGTGTLILTGTNTYAGGTTINSGMLQIGTGDTTGSIVGNVADSGSLIFDRSDNVTFNGVVSGSGSLMQAGSGGLILTGASTYTGGTTINLGTLQIGNGGTTGSISGNVLDDALLVFDRSDNVTFNGVVSGSGSLTQAGTGGLILTGASTYTGGTTISRGFLQIGSGGTSGSIAGNVADSGSLIFDRSDNVTFDGIVSGSGALTQAGTGGLILTGASTYTGGTTINLGTLQLGNGGTTGSIAGNIVDNGTLTFNRSDDFSSANVITGTGGLIKSGSNALTLTGSNAYTGSTQVQSGSLFVDGDQAAAKGATTVANGATFGGKGIVGGDVSVADGATLAPGSEGAIGTLTINGNLGLSSGSVLSYDFAPSTAPSGQVSDLINVHGNLTLDGALALNMAIADTLGPGVYRLINYDGTLTDNGLTAQSGWQIETGIAHQVNLIGAQGASLSFWDGDAGPANNHLIDGGTGTWQSGSAASNKSWTDAGGVSNSAFTDGSFAVFQGAPGIVTVDSRHGDINAAGMQFMSNGYIVQEDIIHLVGSSGDPTHSVIRVGDGTAAGAGYTALIDSWLDGNTTLVKTDAGTLVLGGPTYYTGGTVISGGTLQVGQGGSIGSILGDVTDNGALVFDRSDAVNFSGVISGTGSLTQIGSGTLILTGFNTYTGGTIIGSSGTLQIGNGGTTGAIVGNVLDDGVLAFNQSSNADFNGTISGHGSLLLAGAGTVTLGGPNTYTGGTVIRSGTLQVGNWLTSGSIVGNVTDNGMLSFARQDDQTFNGVISGLGGVVKTGDGHLILQGVNTYTGGTYVAGGTLEVTSNAAIGTGAITVGGYGPYYFDEHILQVDSGLTLSNQILLNYGTINNAGHLGGGLSAGISGDGGTILNHDGASIVGTDTGILIGSVSPGNIQNTNGSVITGGNFALNLGDAGTIVNDGANSVISSTNGIAIQMTGNAGTVVNTGGATITGNLTPLSLVHGGTVTNGAGSTIEATGARDGDCAAAGICSIFVASAAFVTSGDGGLTLNNAGTIIGNVQLIPTAYNNATLTAGGSIHGDLLLGSNTGGFFNLIGDAGTTQLYSQAVTGNTTFAGLLFKKGAGTWIIDNNDLDQVAHIEIDGGTLQFGNGGVDGAISPNVVQIAGGGTLAFDHSNDVTLTSLVTGYDSSDNTSVVQAGTGTLMVPDMRDLGVSYLYIERGTVQFGDGSLATPFAWGMNVVNSGTLAFNFDGPTTFVGPVSGSGALIKQGPGTLILSEASSGYTGNTFVEGGTLRAVGFLRGDVTVDAGATLAGAAPDGSPFGLRNTLSNLLNAGTVDVSLGDAVIVGNYIQASTGTLAVSLGSKLAVDGTATLNGGTLEITGADNGYVSNAHTNVLTATGGLSGTFGSLVKDTGVLFTATTINYDANSVWLDTTGLNITNAITAQGGSFTPASFGSAQRVQAAFTQLDSKIAEGNIASVSKDFVQAAGQFQQAPTVQAAQTSLQSLSGQLLAASAAMTFEAIDASSRALADRFDDVLGKKIGYGMWTHSLNVGGDMGRAGYDGVGFQLNGWLVGDDRQIGNSGVAGFAFGQSQGQQQLDQGYDHNRSRGTEGMAYAGWLNGNWYTQGRIGFGHFQQDVNRQLLLGTTAQGVATDYSGNYNVAYGESGLHLSWAGSRIMPFVNVEYASIDRDGFAEQGAGGFGLRTNAQTLDRWQAGVGLRANHHWDLDGGRALDFNVSAQFQRTLASQGDVFDASFVGLQQWQPLLGIGLSRYSSVLNVGLDAKLSAHTSLNFGYDYEKGQRDQAQMVSAHLIMAF